MGSWGHKLYDDDSAAEAREAYKDLLSKGIDGAEATDRFLEIVKPALNDADDGPIVWLVLADQQWTLGRLEDRVRDKAISLIDEGAGLERWEEQGAKALEARRKVLAELRVRLLSPQPARKAIRVRKPTKIATWEPGELFAFRLRSGKSVVMCLEQVDEGHHATLSALDWIGDELPSVETLQTLPRKPIDLPEGYRHLRQTYRSVLALRKRDVPYDRLTRLGVRIPTVMSRPRELYGGAGDWSRMDQELEELYGWS